MTLHGWSLFAVTVFLLCGTPGPNMLHIMSRSIELGPRRSVAAMAGCLTALVAVLAASAAGLATFLAALPGSFELLRYVGATYLLYLGIRAWRGSGAPVDAGEGVVRATAASPAALFRGGLAISASNPKLILFAAAFLPQFVDPAAPQAPQFSILVATFAVIESFWYGVYALGGRSLAHYVADPSRKRILDHVIGAIFIGFGLTLLTARLA